MMLIAKYVKVLSRTGTLPFLLGCRFRLGLCPFYPKAMGAVFGPLVPPRHISRRILRIKNALGVLAYSHGNHALLGKVPGFGKSLDILSSPRQAFPTAEGQRDSKKIYLWECVLQKEVSDRFALARIPDRCKRKISIAPAVSVDRLSRKLTSTKEPAS